MIMNDVATWRKLWCCFILESAGLIKSMCKSEQA